MNQQPLKTRTGTEDQPDREVEAPAIPTPAVQTKGRTVTAMPRMLPEWMRTYRRQWLRADTIAGLTVLAYLVPQTLAYSGLIGLPPAAGLATALAALVVYALLGTSRRASVGPESTVALMAGLVVAPLVAANPEQAPGLVAALTLMVAFWMAAGWALRGGVIAGLLTKPILTGYLTGGAILMIASQLGKATRTGSDGETVLEQVTSFARGAAGTHWPTLTVAGIALLALLVLPRLLPRVPVALAVVAVATLASAALGLADMGVSELGPLPQGLPTLVMPQFSFETLQTLVIGSMGIALVAFSDMMLTARAFAGKDERVNPNRELLASAGVHAASAFAGGYPSSASSSRTAIAIGAGARTQAGALVTAAGVAAMMLFAGPLLERLPLAVLAAVVIWAATKLIDVNEYRRMWTFRKAEFAVAAATATGTAVLGILPGIAVAVLLSVAHILASLARPHEAIMGYAPGVPGLHDIDDYDNAVTIPGLLLYRYDAPLFFANIDDFQNRLLQAVQDTDPRTVILNVEANMLVDYTACETLKTLLVRFQQEGRTVGLARLKNDLRSQLDAAGVLDIVGERCYATLPEAINAYKDENPDVAMPPMPPPGQAFEP